MTLSVDIKEALNTHDKAVPRYTSYPPATLFNKKVTAQNYQNWLANISDKEELSLYVHLPFCRSLCLYCGCNMQVTQSQDRMVAYMDALLTEIENVHDTCPENLRVSSLHLGGGTPTYMPQDQLARLFKSLKERFVFSDNAELAVEVDPRNCDADMVAFLAKMGINRVSLGVQDFDEKVQEAISRVQPYDKVKACVDMFRSAGIAAINFDLIYGLPCQTETSITDTINAVSKLKPSRISLFGYAHVPWIKKHQKVLEKHNLPDKFARFSLSELSRQQLINAGYMPVGIDHFALPEDDLILAQKNKTLHRNFQGYTTDTAKVLLGFGASAISQLPQGMLQNNPNITAYQEDIKTQKLATIHGYEKTAQDAFFEQIILELMCRFSVNPQKIAAEFDVPEDVMQNVMREVETLMQEGLLIATPAEYIIPEDYKLFARTVCARLDPYYQETPQRHAQAV